MGHNIAGNPEFLRIFEKIEGGSINLVEALLRPPAGLDFFPQNDLPKPQFLYPVFIGKDQVRIVGLDKSIQELGLFSFKRLKLCFAEEKAFLLVGVSRLPAFPKHFLGKGDKLLRRAKAFQQDLKSAFQLFFAN